MSDSKLPTEVELVYELMPCNAMRVAQEPGKSLHPCSYFRKWGTYHSYDYVLDEVPPEPGIIHKTKYVGRAPLVPEMLSGCRKAPIVAVGINPNLPGWWPFSRQALNPLFDNYKQYAHYFRYRAVAKLMLPLQDYEDFGGGPDDTPFSDFELNVPVDEDGNRTVRVEVQRQKMYEAYEWLLFSLAEKMGWANHRLALGEDLAYGNMIGCPSARWTTVPVPEDPTLPPMTVAERTGIVTECFRERGYFLRQLFQSLPAVLLVFSQSTTNALLGELHAQGYKFSEGDPQVGETVDELGERIIRLHYGDLADGSALEARVIFAPHITGNPEQFLPARKRVVRQLVEEANSGNIGLNALTGHLKRSRGACVLCPMLEIGPCDYVDELQPISLTPALTADSSLPVLQLEKATQISLMGEIKTETTPVEVAWAGSDEIKKGDSTSDA
jgi:hypothetical protein